MVEKYTLCQIENTIELQLQYWKNTPGNKYNYNCSNATSIAMMAGAVMKSRDDLVEKQQQQIVIIQQGGPPVANAQVVPVEGDAKPPEV